MTKEQMVIKGMETVRAFNMLKRTTKRRLARVGATSKSTDALIDKVLQEKILPMAQFLDMKYHKTEVENAMVFMEEDGQAYLMALRDKINKALENIGA